MSDLHGKILSFLMTEWAREGSRQLVGVDLLYSPGTGFHDEEVRRWERADEPELFASIEKLVNQIVEIATCKVIALVSSPHRFVVRTRQFLGMRASLSFHRSNDAPVTLLSDPDLDLRQQALERQALEMMEDVEVCRVEARRRANEPRAGGRDE